MDNHEVKGLPEEGQTSIGNIAEAEIVEVVYKPNYGNVNDLVGFAPDGEKVIPSLVGVNPPEGSSAYMRIHEPIPGQLDLVTLVRQGDVLTGYPANQEQDAIKQLVGVEKPFLVEWAVNEEREGVIAFYFPDPQSDFYYKIFLGQNGKGDKFSPQPAKTGLWRSYPRPGQKTLCWLGWIMLNHHWCGLAFPVISTESTIQKVVTEVEPASVQTIKEGAQAIVVEVPVTAIGNARVVIYKKKTYTLTVPDDQVVKAYDDDGLVIEIG